jgi:hypothetical protein
MTAPRMIVAKKNFAFKLTTNKSGAAAGELRRVAGTGSLLPSTFV